SEYDYWADYDRIPTQEKERFAHNYAAKTMEKLRFQDSVPFDRILNQKTLESEGLDILDFIIDEK
ncbi:MAG: hypothetical protein AAF806_16075, partial [Bacteroidota bacterium]